MIKILVVPLRNFMPVYTLSYAFSGVIIAILFFRIMFTEILYVCASGIQLFGNVFFSDVSCKTHWLNNKEKK